MAYRLSGKVLAFVRTQRVARLATIGPRQTPHNIAVCTVNVAGYIYFASAANARKVRNLRRCPNVALAFDAYTERWSHLAGAMIAGSATVIARGPVFKRIRQSLYRKYRQFPRVAPIVEDESVIVRITPTACFSWGL